jgi:hypothetical protein
MATVTPSWAYVWGRYLVGLLMSLGLATLLLAAILGVGAALHLTVAGYPTPELGAALALWSGMVLPATVVVSSLGFAVATLFPRLSTVVKVVLLVSWVVGAVVLPSVIFHDAADGPYPLPTAYSAWDPTSAVTARVLLNQQYKLDFGPQTALPATPEQFQQLLNSLANRMPDLSAWFAPHLLEAALSILLVGVVAFAFQRFRNTSGA